VADFVVDVGVVDDAGVEVVVVVVLVDDEADVRAVVAAVEDDEPMCEVVVAALVEPGCSFATRTPTRASDAVAASATDPVIRRRRICARWRDWGELRSTASNIAHSFSSDHVMKPSLPSPHPTARLASAVTRGRDGLSQTAISQLTTKADAEE
jgi:hypothetical protein